MSRFSVSKKGSTKTVNHEGAVAYQLDPKMELYSLVCTASLQKKFYEGVDETIARLEELIQLVPQEFVCKLAIYAREKMYLRSIPLVLMIELLKYNKETDRGNFVGIRPTITRIIQRPDEITEILAYYQIANDRKGLKKLNALSNTLKKGIADSFNKFNEYQFAKYSRNTEIKLRDAMFLTHPIPNKGNEVLFNKIANNKLETPDTWEVALSKKDGIPKKEKWERLIDEGKLGYMAALRNLRNMVEENVSNLEKVLALLADPDNVIKSKQFPFRFLSAWKAVQGLPTFCGSQILNYLEDAIEASAYNIKGVEDSDNIFVAIDTSGSMTINMSEKSSVTYMDTAMVMGMLLKSRCNKVLAGIFGEDFMPVTLPSDNILMNVDKLKRLEGKVGHSTNGHLAIEYLINTKLMADKVMMFTDCQLWDSGWGYEHLTDYWHKYKKINPKAELYLFDMAGYGDTPISIREPGVYLIAGWSEKIFDVLEAIKNGGNAISVIEEINIG